MADEMFHDKAIPWTNRASSRSKIDPENMKKPPSKVAHNRPTTFFMYWPGCPNGPETEIPYHQKQDWVFRLGLHGNPAGIPSLC